MKQTPSPGAELLVHHGDVLTFTMDVPAGKPGRAWLRTNLGRAEVKRHELIDSVEKGRAILARDWHDVPMRAISDASFVISLPAAEIGSFEAKCLFVPEGTDTILWPEGPNTRIKIEPAWALCGNSIYTAFVRQFGPGLRGADVQPDTDSAAVQLDGLGYTVIPPSGTFRGLIRELDFIVGALGCRILQLLPIHPVPTTYARMGRFGSPFAGLDFMDVDPSLAEFDKRTTPMDQFRELVHATHARYARIFLDIPINHTGWASALQIHHPEWFARNEDRSFQSPGAWGVTWEDLARLDYRVTTLWSHMADVFLFWCRQGVDGFRCDAGYMIPEPVWSYIVAKVREQYPETVFLLEGLGGSIHVMEDLLFRSGMNWAYSELFQNYDRETVSSCVAYAARISSSRGTLVHYAETHDNPRLAAKSHTYARMRTALAALCSVRGAFGITSGVEWFATAKVDVHGAPPLNWGHPTNQAAEIGRLNTLLAIHPCFHDGVRVEPVQQGEQNVVVIRRRTDGASLLVVANLDDSRPSVASWNESSFTARGGLIDLLGGQPVRVERKVPTVSCALAPGQILCLTASAQDLEQLNAATDTGSAPRLLDAPERQRLKAAVVDAWHAVHPNAGMQDVDLDGLAETLRANPEAFIARIHPRAAPPPLVRWNWPRDLRRTVMVPPGRFLLIRAPNHFTVELRDEHSTLRQAKALRCEGDAWFVLLPPLPTPETSNRLTLEIRYFGVEGPASAQVSVLYLSEGNRARVSLNATPAGVTSGEALALCTNGRNAMSFVRGAWGEVRSQYDAMLAANLDPEVPVDRHVLLTRCRAWLVNRGYSQQIGAACQERFSAGSEGGAAWRFVVPAGMGRQVTIEAAFNLARDRNAATLSFTRVSGGTRDESLDDAEQVTIIVRPDIEDRINHCNTKAYDGPEKNWPGAIAAVEDGFTFRPAAGRSLTMTARPGKFISDPEWSYMVAHPHDADRGFDGAGDLFSPGYFSLALRGGETACLYADAEGSRHGAKGEVAPPHVAPLSEPARIEDILLSAMRAFLVKRNEGLTVIAGYPWFLDWGRDTLIALRGFIAGGFHDEAREIIRQFASFEERGTLPNMIRGKDAGNRDTSDAPLWMFVACADLASSNRDLFKMKCGDRPLAVVLHSIAEHYIAGTPNGIRMDESSGLIFSPAHFTWMDTNFPAGTPRQGYPIEIQALWHAALRLLAAMEADSRWVALADKVKASVVRHYVQPNQAFLSDCLHAEPGTPAIAAKPDDALRPNQLFALCLGAVDDAAVCASALSACEELLVPGGIRSLADRPVRHGLPVRRDGQLLNDPHRPYWGQYRGDEDTHRKPAYHNGTAWTWPFPSYAEAMFLLYGERSRRTALSILGSSAELLQRQCLGHLPELTDGDAPHAPKGTPAQAWSVTELYRVLTMLQSDK